MSSVVKKWVGTELSYKQQTVLLSALRGCDGIAKEDVSKVLTRAMRGTILLSALGGGRDRPGTFMYTDTEMLTEKAKLFLNNMDHYPVHWLMHFAHAAEIIGYYHPDINVAAWWRTLYLNICAALHVRPELYSDCVARLADGEREIDT